MALFSRSKAAKTAPKAKTPKAGKATSEKAETVTPVAGNLAHVLMSPRITEKATMTAQNNVYVFDVAAAANKKQIMAAVESIYKVKPRKIAIVTIHSKAVRNMRTGARGVKGGGKKAYVYLKSGETITIA